MFTRCLGVLLVCSTCILPQIAQGQENQLAKKLLGLSRVTGNEPVVGAYSELLEDAAETKKLIQFAREQVKKNPEALDYNAAFILAEAAKKLEDVDSAALFYRIAAKKAAKLESTRKLLQSYGGLIYLLYDNKDYKGCERACRELLELQTGSGKPREVYLAVSVGRGEPFFIRVDSYDSVQQLKPTFREIEIKAIAKQGRTEEALRRATNLIDAENNWTNNDLKAWIYYEAGRYQQALRAYEDVLAMVAKDPDLRPEGRTALEDRYRYILSNVHMNLGQTDKAIELLRALVARHPNDPTYNNDLGYIMADHGIDLKEAEGYIRKAIDLDRERRKSDPAITPEEDKDNGAYLDSMGWVLYKQKKYKEAKEWLEKAVQDKDAQHIEIYDHLGDTYMALGERDAALQAWRRGLEVATSTPRDQERRKLVQEKIEKHSK